MLPAARAGLSRIRGELWYGFGRGRTTSDFGGSWADALRHHFPARRESRRVLPCTAGERYFEHSAKDRSERPGNTAEGSPVLVQALAEFADRNRNLQDQLADE